LSIVIEKVSLPEDFVTVESLAGEIWREHYTPIIGAAQVEYMLKNFQSLDAMKRQTGSEGYTYRMIKSDGIPAGYLATAIHGDRLFLSKIYIKKEYRGRGLSSKAIKLCEDLCKENELRAIYLTVNKYNPSVKIYESLGFKTIDSVKTDIGSGFYMDDYIMEKTI